LPRNEDIFPEELERVQEELASAEKEKEIMSEQMESMENEKIAADGENLDLKKKVEELEAALKAEKDQHAKAVKELDKLQEELQRKEMKWIEKEKFINDQVEASDRQVESLNSTLSNMQEVLAQNMDLTELKGKVTAQQKQIMALEMDVRSAKIEVDQKNHLDAKKSKLIELLDKRLAQSQEEIQQLQVKKNKLCNMVDTMLRDKDRQTKKLIEATHQITELCRQNDSRIQEIDALTKSNEELKKMLDDLKFKGVEIAKLAKEKVLKYKDESKNLQKELDALKEGLPPGSCEQLEQLQEELKEVAAKTAAREEHEAQLSELQGQLNAALEGVGEKSEIAELLATLQKSESISAEIKTIMAEMKEDRAQMKKERELMETKIAHLERENEGLRKIDVGQVGSGEGENTAKDEEMAAALAAKEKEIEQLKQELSTIKATIGALLGTGLGGAPQVSS
jgi:chromosome segregation ATPase